MLQSTYYDQSYRSSVPNLQARCTRQCDSIVLGDQRILRIVSYMASGSYVKSNQGCAMDRAELIFKVASGRLESVWELLHVQIV